MATQAERTDATTGRLLDAARKLFGELGYAQTPTEDVVVAAEVTRGALYHHFGNKEGLFAAVLDREEERLAAAVVKVAAKLPTPRERLQAGCRVFLETCLSPEYQRIAILDAPAVLGVDRAREIGAAHMLRMLSASLREASPELSRAHAEVRATLLFGAMCHAATFIARASSPKAAMKVVAVEVASLVDAVIASDTKARAASA